MKCKKCNGLGYVRVGEICSESGAWQSTGFNKCTEPDCEGYVREESK